MINCISKKIDALPSLTKTVIELQKFKREDMQEISELLRILEKDPLIMATLLKVVNSAMFGFRHKFETKKAVELIEINFTLSIAFENAVKSTFNTNLDAYELTSDQLLDFTNIINKWISAWDYKLKEELLLAIFLQEIGQCILSDLTNEYKITSNFYEAIKKDFLKIPEIEKQLFIMNLAQVTASVFEQWKLKEDLIAMIRAVNDLSKCDPKHLKHTQVLSVIKVLCNPVKPLSSKAVEKAIDLAKEYKFDVKSLEKAIEIMEDRL